MIKADAQVEAGLVRGSVGEFTEVDLDGLPEPVKRFFRATVAPNAPVAQSVRIEMRGQIKIGHWLPFRAMEVLTPHVGFLWTARAAGVISGHDRLVDGRAEMRWRLAGAIPVMNAAGPDVTRSGSERAAAEAIWVPTTLLPRFGVKWAASDQRHISARYRIDRYPIEVAYSLSSDGLVRSVAFDRWGDPETTGVYAVHPFGGDFTAHARFHGMTIPTEGRLGWHYGTDQWSKGEFFRYRITDMEPYSV